MSHEREAYEVGYGTIYRTVYGSPSEPRVLWVYEVEVHRQAAQLTGRERQMEANVRDAQADHIRIRIRNPPP